MESQPWTNMDIAGILSSLPDPHSRHPTFLPSEGKGSAARAKQHRLSQGRLSSGTEVKSG